MHHISLHVVFVFFLHCARKERRQSQLPAITVWIINFSPKQGQESIIIEIKIKTGYKTHWPDMVASGNPLPFSRSKSVSISAAQFRVPVVGYPPPNYSNWRSLANFLSHRDKKKVNWQHFAGYERSRILIQRKRYCAT